MKQPKKVMAEYIPLNPQFAVKITVIEPAARAPAPGAETEIETPFAVPA
jgi:hypothetical protein